MKLIFDNESHNLDGIFSDQRSSIALELKLFGKPLVAYNIQKLISIYGSIDCIRLPAESHEIVRAIEISFPSIPIEESNSVSEILDPSSLRMKINSVVSGPSKQHLVIDTIVYPWDILKAMNHVLSNEITSKNISKEASVAPSVVIDGPCVIEDGVSIEDFCKIKGPIYIGPDTEVGDGNLLRNSFIGPECKIGFGNEIGRSYLAGSDTVPHVDIILDTIMGKRVWMGAYVGTTNVMLNNRSVRYELNHKLIDTSLSNFGAVFDHDSTVGAGVIVLPGRRIPANCIVQPGTVFQSAEKSGLTNVLVGSQK